MEFKFTSLDQDFLIFKELVESTPFTFAKTMSNIPHEWIFRGSVAKNIDIQKWFFAVAFIRKYGYVKKFYSKEFTYFDYNGHQYWTMGAPIEETTIINRAKL